DDVQALNLLGVVALQRGEPRRAAELIRCRAPKKQPGDHYTAASYPQAVRRAIERANRARRCEACRAAEAPCEACVAHQLPHWHPHQIRHAVATHIEEQYGEESARVLLGHRSRNITRRYVHPDFARAAAIAAKTG